MSNDSGESEFAMAFGEGSDSRIAGRPLTANPYGSLREQNGYHGWRLGWLSAEKEWAVQARWPHRLLPLVLPVNR